MRSFIGVCLVLTIGASAGCGQSYSNVCTYSVSNPDCKALVVIAQGFNDALGWITPGGELRIVTADMQRLGGIGDLMVSADGRRVLLVSCGEGDEFVSIYRFRDIVDLWALETIAPVGILDPYPYGFDDIHWVDNDCVQFSSNADFHHFNKETRRGAYSDEWDDSVRKTWRWRLTADTFEEVAPR